MIPTGHRFSHQSNGFKSWKWRYATYLPISGCSEMCLDYLRSLQQKHNVGCFFGALTFWWIRFMYIYIMYTIFAHRLGLEQTPSWKKCWQSNMDTVLWFKSYIWLTLRYLGFHVCRVLNFPSKRHVPFPTTTAKQSKPCNGQPTRRKPGRA